MRRFWGLVENPSPAPGDDKRNRIKSYFSAPLVSFGAALLLLCGLAAGPVHAQGDMYIVRPGDTLTGIAARYGVSAGQLAAANRLHSASWVYVGQRLAIPGHAATPAVAAPSTAGQAYVVRPGDTLTGIARRHGIAVSQLAAANGLRANAWVYAGQRLTIPGQAVASAPAVSSASAGVYIVRPGDTLTGIAARYGISLSQLAAANGLRVNAWVYAGQRLAIPGQAPASPMPATAPIASNIYTVRPGDTLIAIAQRHGVAVSQLAARNGLYWNSWVYVGQRLAIPGRAQTPAPAAPSAPATATNQPAQNANGKWIDVSLSTQTLTAYQGETAVLQTRVSTGVRWYPTVAGTFKIYAKYASTRMRGPGYDLPNVPYVMYFYRGYGLHGTYWHNNFGTPMSHGCVNLPTDDAKWLFNWAPVGTRVVTHY
jgi:LysM repeat protein